MGFTEDGHIRLREGLLAVVQKRYEPAWSEASFVTRIRLWFRIRREVSAELKKMRSDDALF